MPEKRCGILMADVIETILTVEEVDWLRKNSVRCVICKHIMALHAVDSNYDYSTKAVGFVVFCKIDNCNCRSIE